MFDFFKRHKKETPPPENESSIVLCIPTSCKSREELFGELTQNNLGEFLLAGMVLMNLKTKDTFGLEVAEKDLRMSKSFEVAGKVNHLSEEFLKQIEAHETVVYLIGKSGSFEASFAIACAARAVLNSGGLGVKVESSGKAFTPEQWLSMSEQFDEMSLYDLFVVETIYDQSESIIYSCGMHNIGYKDVAVRNVAFEPAYELIRMFNVFRFVDKPVINEGETFSLSADSERFVIRNMDPTPTDGQELFENQFGFWELEKV